MVANSPMQLPAATENKENKGSFHECLATVSFCGWLGFLVLQGLGFWICFLGLEVFFS